MSLSSIIGCFLKSSIVLNHMIQNIRKEALLGDPPERFYMNASECINIVLKLKVDRKSRSLIEFVDHAQELVLINAGNYYWLKLPYDHNLGVPLLVLQLLV